MVVKTGERTALAAVKDVGGGLFTAMLELPASGKGEVDVTFQGQSIAGFPVAFNMDQQAQLSAFFQVRKVEEDLIFLQKKLGKRKETKFLCALPSTQMVLDQTRSTRRWTRARPPLEDTPLASA